MVSACHGPAWQVDDFSLCFEHVYLQFWPLVITLLISLLVLIQSLSPLLFSKLKSSSLRGSTDPLLVNSDATSYGATTSAASGTASRSITVPSEDKHDPNDPISLIPKDVTFVTVVRSSAERARVAIEAVLVVLNFGLSLAALLYAPANEEWNVSGIKVPQLLIAFWGYCLLIILVRIIFTSAKKVPPGGLWYHSTALYTVAFLFELPLFRSALLHPITHAAKVLHIIYTLSTFSLVVANSTAKVADKPVSLYVSPGTEPSVEPISSIYALLTYSWIDPLIWRGYWNSLQMDDLWDLRADDHAIFTLTKFRAIKGKSAFWYRLLKNFKYELFLQAMWALLVCVSTISPPVLVKKILDYVSDYPNSPTPPSVIWLYVVGIFFVSIFNNIFNGQALFIGRRICIRLRSIIIGEVYAKALRRKAVAGADSEIKLKDSTADKNKGDEVDKAKNTTKEDKKEEEGGDGQANIGAIINLMAVDAFKVAEIAAYLHYFVEAVGIVVLAIVLLYGLLGWSAFVGASVFLLIMPLNYLFAKKFGELQAKMMAITDQRIDKLNELLQSIRILKFFAWENKFVDGVLEIREKELTVLWHRFILWAFGALIWYSTPTLITIFAFGSFTMLEGKTLTSPIAFTALSLFNIMRAPMDQLADMISNVLQSKVSIDRVEKFLDEGETTKYEQLHGLRGPNSPYIGFEKAKFSWVKDTDGTEGSAFKLRDIDVSFKVGELNLIVGPTGSGKTSLLMALLGEMELDEGRVFLPGAVPRHLAKPDPATGLTENVAYCAQQAWLLNDTVKNNILFDSEFNAERYNEVIEACSLKRDLEILDNGDETEVGEKGITLSGGQKQRISLARAMYSTSKHLILDDCLSAVDSHTAAHIYDKCFCGPISAGRTLILVSHNVALTIAAASFVVVMDNGRIAAQGSPSEVVDTGALGADDLVKASASASKGVSRVGSSVNMAKDGANGLLKKAVKGDASKHADTVAEAAAVLARSGEEDQGAAKKDKVKSKLIKEETKAEGSVKSKVYWEYLAALGGTVFVLGGFFTFIVAQLTTVAQSLWLRDWTVNLDAGLSSIYGSLTSLTNEMTIPLSSAYFSNDTFHVAAEKHSSAYYLTGYFLIGLVLMIMGVIRELYVFHGSVRASRIIFEDLLHHIVRAKLRFFDSTPLGRIMNRFSKDVEAIDQDLAPVSAGVFGSIMGAATITFLIVSITPQFLIAGVFIFALYWSIGVFYLATSRELKRLDSIYKSPVYQHFGETLNGVVTVRAYNEEKRFVGDNLAKIDANNRPFFYLWVANRWLSFRIDFAGAFVSFFAAVFVVLAVAKLDAGLAGISLSYALAFNDNVLWIVRLYAVMEMNLNSVERIQEYMEVDSEAPAIIEGSRPPAHWPSEGDIEFSNLSLRYDPSLPLVIKNVSFEVKSHEKVGVVGRTGAGKSTIITALFRIMEADTGYIKIDGIDISTIGLQDLRKAVAIIPQDPVLFIGTIRSNLDPFEEYTDDEIFTALRRVHLLGDTSNQSRSVPGENINQFESLDSKVAESGNNLSQGQRQLMCLARALLKSPKILLLDEATASIDYETDKRIQKTIRDEFRSTSILTIAHRLRSIADYDKILVLDAGCAVEYDTPYNLLNRDSVFKGMCEESGEMDALIELAKATKDK